MMLSFSKNGTVFEIIEGWIIAHNMWDRIGPTFSPVENTKKTNFVNNYYNLEPFTILQLYSPIL